METAKNLTNDEMICAYGLDVDGRTIFMSASSEHDNCGVIDTSNADHVIKSIHILTTSDKKTSKKPITIIMNSPGGIVYDGNAIYDAIKTCSAPITIIGLGSIMSMASVIFQAADQRLLGPSATIMMHYGETGYGGDANPEKRKNENKEEARLLRSMTKIYLDRIQEKHPKFTKKKLHELMLEKYLSASQAVRLGLADRVIHKPKK